MTERSPTRVATFDDPVIAHIARSKLESHGILATLDGEYHVAMDWLVSNAVGGIKLLVASRRYQTAGRETGRSRSSADS